MAKKRRSKASGGDARSQAKATEPSTAEPESPREFKKSVVRDYFESIVIAVVLALFVRTFVVQTFKIPSSSMEETLLVGDHILVNKFALARDSRVVGPLLPYDEIERNDVIVFKYPDTPEVDYIKRVIGLPGERVELRQGKVYIDGVPIDEDPHVTIKRCNEQYPVDPQAFYAHSYYLTPRLPGGEPGAPTESVIPAGHFLVFGDNRNCSSDSRRWGYVPRDHIKGRALLVYWSFDGQKGEPDTLDAKVGVLRDVGLHFFTRTRWERTLQMVR